MHARVFVQAKLARKTGDVHTKTCKFKCVFGSEQVKNVGAGERKQTSCKSLKDMQVQSRYTDVVIL